MLIEQCNNSDGNGEDIAILIVLFLQYVLFTPQNILSLTLLVLTPPDDMMMGVCKLDNLIKISCFQEYKDPRDR